MRATVRIARTTDGVDTLIVEPPVNLGAPVNSARDDLFPVVRGDSIYVTSDRRDGTDLDVYVSVKQQLAKTPTDTVQPTASTVLRGTVVNLTTNQAVADAEVTATNTSTRAVLAATRTDTGGRYELRLPVETSVTVSAQSDDLFYATYDTTLPASTAGTVVDRAVPAALPSVFVLRVNFPTSVFDAPYAMTLDSNGNETTEPWQAALDMLAANVRASGSTLRRLVLTGHTDDVDTEAKNRVLAQQRVDFVIDQLVLRGIARTTLEGRSAGESELPTRRLNEDIDQWRKRARRVELVKVMQQ
jgi:outer membrane protein OmpA-like peptidoglycan-associated protein